MTETVLSALDTWRSRNWREEERLWRAEEIQWREQERAFLLESRKVRQLEKLFMERKLRYRQEDLRQRRLNNARYHWQRISERHFIDVDEKSELLRNFGWLAGIVANFTLTTPVEFTLTFNSISTPTLTAYAISTALAPSLMIISGMLCIHLHRSILNTSKWFVSELAEEEFITDCREYVETKSERRAPPRPRQTFHQFWDIRCEGLWKMSFCLFTCGTALFMTLVGVVMFIKFVTSNLALSISCVAIMAIFFLIWLAYQISWGSYLHTNDCDPVSLITSSAIENLSEQNPVDQHTCSESVSDLVSEAAEHASEVDECNIFVHRSEVNPLNYCDKS